MNLPPAPGRRGLIAPLSAALPAILLKRLAARGPVAGAAAMASAAGADAPPEGPRGAAAVAPVRLAVLGDSDSQSFHDDLTSGYGTPLARGGAFQAVTWQWTEALERLRPGRIDQGAFASWGEGRLGSRIRFWLGLPTRVPRKRDFAHNFAISGATCDRLVSGRGAQAPALAAMLDAHPQDWERALIVVRIGINSLGTPPQMARFASGGLDADNRAQALSCVGAIEQTVRRIRRRHAEPYILLVGVLDNAEEPTAQDRTYSPGQRQRIRSVLDLFDEGLRAIAARDPRARFLDDRAWFHRHWLAPDPDGWVSAEGVSLGGPRRVTLTRGDEPWHAVLADGHAGTVWNGLWAATIVEIVNTLFGTTIPPIRRDEVARLADPDGRYGLAPPATQISR